MIKISRDDYILTCGKANTLNIITMVFFYDQRSLNIGFFLHDSNEYERKYLFSDLKISENKL